MCLNTRPADYWTSNTGGWCGASEWTDLWGSDGPAYGKNNSWACTDQAQLPHCVYEDDMFTNFTVNAIRAHNASQPLFLYFAPHAVHLPLEVPAGQLQRFNFINGSDPRRRYAAMTNLVDAHIGAVVDALVARGMWDNTLLLLTADNGGPIFGQASTCKICDGSAGANNWPLRGGKHSGWEGGIRANAFVTGGFLPREQRGTARTGLVAIEDWFVTFCGLAGITDPSDARAAAAGLPPVEGFDMWPLVSGANLTSPRTEVVIGSHVGADGVGAGPAFVQGLIRADGWKLLWNNLTMNIWTGACVCGNSWRQDTAGTHTCCVFCSKGPFDPPSMHLTAHTSLP